MDDYYERIWQVKISSLRIALVLKMAGLSLIKITVAAII